MNDRRFGWVQRWFAKPFKGVRFPRLSPYLKYFPEWEPRYVVRDGKRLGPFLYSTQWTSLEEFEKQVFGSPTRREFWQKFMKDHASNKLYQPPKNPVHLARDVILQLEEEYEKKYEAPKNPNVTRWRDEAIAARKELSELKRLKELSEFLQDLNKTEMKELEVGE